MICLVTGGAGFIGSNLTERLLKNGHTVKVIDNFVTGRKENIASFVNDVEFIEGDIRDYSLIEKIVDGVDVIFHQAALPSVPRSIADPMTSNDVNINGTLNILNAAKEKKVQRVVFASSSSVYGDTPELPKHEKMPVDPLSPYAVTKLAGERYCRVFNNVYGLKTFSLRYFNVFGPRQDPNSQYSAVIPKFITAMLSGKQPVIYGDGEQSRDFTFIDNVVDANLLAATVEADVYGLAMNSACHDRTTLNDLVKELNVILGTNINPIYAEPRKGDIKHSFAEISLAEKTLSYKPSVPFKEGLSRTVEFFKN